MENLNYQTNKADIKSACDIEPMPALFLNALEWKADQNDIYNVWRMMSGNISLEIN